MILIFYVWIIISVDNYIVNIMSDSSASEEQLLWSDSESGTDDESGGSGESDRDDREGNNALNLGIWTQILGQDNPLLAGWVKSYVSCEMFWAQWRWIDLLVNRVESF